ncbi:peptide chain release factor N(5)-glutamine methyltransferase [Viridibacterium curvum]|uniref:Release factor glutamine methyltransferase n=1 Tax=Viridibacterium curvum TaxID=1101404 RepID=A0ABP9QKM7_9RHOO
MSLPRTLGDALALARGRIDSVDAKVLLREASGYSASMLIAFPERVLDADKARLFADWLVRREAGEPVAHLVGHREFYGHLFRVTADTLIPRPDTELLVERGLAVLAATSLSLDSLSPSPSPASGPGEPRAASPSARPGGTGNEPARRQQFPLPEGEGGRQAGRGGMVQAPTVLDLGTGTGAIAISIALASAAQVTAVDTSPAALAVAQDNARHLGAAIRCLHGSWFAPVAGKRFDLIVSNPPYIAEGDPHLVEGDVRFEPRSALTSGRDGLDDIRHIVTAAPAHLNDGGWLLLEHGYDQAAAVRALLSAAGYAEVQSWRDLAGIERVSGGRR